MYTLAGGVHCVFAVFSIYIVVLGVRRDPIGFAVPWRFKTLDSQPEKSNMGPVPVHVHDF